MFHLVVKHPGYQFPINVPNKVQDDQQVFDEPYIDTEEQLYEMLRGYAKRPPDFEPLIASFKKARDNTKILVVSSKSTSLDMDAIPKIHIVDSNESREELCAYIELFLRTYILPLQKKCPEIHPQYNEMTTERFLERVAGIKCDFKSTIHLETDGFEASELERKHLTSLVYELMRFLLHTTYAMRIMDLNRELKRLTLTGQTDEPALISVVKECFEVPSPLSLFFFKVVSDVLLVEAEEYEGWLHHNAKHSFVYGEGLHVCV